MANISMKSLLESGVHFGHRTHRWHPQMKPYIFTERNGIHIIDLQQTVKSMDEAYNLIRDLQMQLEPPTRTTTRKRSTLWQFEQVSTIRRTVIQRAGRLSTPSGKLMLTFCTGKNLKQRVLQIFDALAT